MKKNTHSLVLSSILIATPAFVSAQLLVDVGNFSGGDPTMADFTASGVSEDLSNAVLASFLNGGGGGNAFNASPTISYSYSPNVSGVSNASTWTTNDMLRDYAFTFGGTTTTTVIDGLDATINGTGPTGSGFVGNSFTLLPDTNYYVYFFGAGDSDNQDTLFTLLPSSGTVVGSSSGTTSPVIVGSPDNTHFVKLEFITPSVIDSSYEFSFTWAGTTGDGSGVGALNGIAIVAVPEPSNYALQAGAAGLIAALALRRKRAAE